jgi:hypothetical protein
LSILKNYWNYYLSVSKEIDHGNKGFGYCYMLGDSSDNLVDLARVQQAIAAGGAD